MPKVNPAKDFVAGAAGGVCCVAAGHPFDTVKVRLQTTNLFNGAADCFLNTVKKEGPLGLYKGMAAPIVGVTPMFAICFAGYGFGKKIQQRGTNRELTLPEICNAGMISAVVQTSIMVPGERIKCLLQIQTAHHEKQFNGPIDCVRKLYREGGIRSLYRGTGATLLRDVPGSGVYFTVYEGLRRYMAKDGKEPGPLKVLFAGGMAGVGMWSVVIPFDTLKSRMQTAPEGKYSSVRHVFTDIIRENGYKGLYRGVVPVLLRAFPANAACFLGYEMTLKFLNFVIPE